MNYDEEFYEDESQIENFDDMGTLDKNIFSSAVVSGNDWTAETIVNQINKENIQLNPSFQRRDAWDKKRKSRFIESLILGLPVPQVVLAESKVRRGSYIVLDGKQRLLSIRQFAAAADDQVYSQLKLTSLEIRNDLKGMSLDSLRNDFDYADDLAAFENQPIRTVVIKNWPNEDFLYHVFLRLNTGSVPLSPQELRQALHPGAFVSFLDSASSESIALKEILKLSKPDFRMRDAELLLRYFAFKNFIGRYSGTLKTFLDDACKEFNKDWDIEKEKINIQLTEFEESHTLIKKIFGQNYYRKWSGKSYESRFNRSIFDIMVWSFTQPNVRSAVQGNEVLVENSFKELCINDRKFLSSIESTTKSLTATHTRLSTWAKTLNDTLGLSLMIPELIDNRIV